MHGRLIGCGGCRRYGGAGGDAVVSPVLAGTAVPGAAAGSERPAPSPGTAGSEGAADAAGSAGPVDAVVSLVLAGTAALDGASGSESTADAAGSADSERPAPSTGEAGPVASAGTAGSEGADAAGSARTRLMSRTACHVPRHVPVTFERPVRGRYGTSTSLTRHPASAARTTICRG